MPIAGMSRRYGAIHPRRHCDRLPGAAVLQRVVDQIGDKLRQELDACLQDACLGAGAARRGARCMAMHHSAWLALLELERDHAE